MRKSLSVPQIGYNIKVIGNIKKQMFFVGTLIVLFLSFSINFFGAMDTNSFIGNYKDSEALISNEVICRGSVFGGQLIEAKNASQVGPIKNCDKGAIKPYSSQFGLQGRIYTLGYKIITSVLHISAGAYIALAELITALLSAILFTLFAVWIRKNFSLFVANIATLLIAVSPMIVGFSRNLYWALPLMVAPFLFTIIFYKYPILGRRRIFFWIILGVLLYARFLCGYEYITSITIMVMAAVGYHLGLQKKPYKIYTKELALAFVISVIAFTAALSTHVYTLQKSTGSTEQAVTVIKDRALVRTLDSSKYLSYPYYNYQFLLKDSYLVSDSYLHLQKRSSSGSQLWASIVSFMNYSLLPIIVLPIALNQPFATYLQSISMFTIFLLYLYKTRNRWVHKGIINQVEALFLGAAIGFVGFLSWLVLAHSHSLVHAHINGILMYLPYALFGYIIMGLYFQIILGRIWKRFKYART